MWTSLQILGGSILLSKIHNNTPKSQSVWMQQRRGYQQGGVCFHLAEVPVSTGSIKKSVGSSAEYLEKINLWGAQPTTGSKPSWLFHSTHMTLSPANFPPTLPLSFPSHTSPVLPQSVWSVMCRSPQLISSDIKGAFIPQHVLPRSGNWNNSWLCRGAASRW